MKYNCSFPDCGFETNSRKLIELHHVTPKEIDPRSSNKVTIPLCPTCHRKIWHPKSKNGHHSILTEESLEIKGIFKSTDGDMILYENPKTKEETYFSVRLNSVL